MGALARPILSAFQQPLTGGAVQAIDDSVRAFASQHFANVGGVSHASMPGLVLSSLAPIALIAAIGASTLLVQSVAEGSVARRGAWRSVRAVFGVHNFLLLPLVELVIKPAVHRLRPDVLHHHSFSFPSGHTTSATYVTGALLLVLLPRLIEALSDARADGMRFALPPRPLLLGAWAAVSVGTGLGRILADAHWFSDTLVGAVLGAVLLLGVALPLAEHEPADETASGVGASSNSSTK